MRERTDEIERNVKLLDEEGSVPHDDKEGCDEIETNDGQQ